MLQTFKKMRRSQERVLTHLYRPSVYAHLGMPASRSHEWDKHAKRAEIVMKSSTSALQSTDLQDFCFRK